MRHTVVFRNGARGVHHANSAGTMWSHAPAELFSVLELGGPMWSTGEENRMARTVRVVQGRAVGRDLRPQRRLSWPPRHGTCRRKQRHLYTLIDALEKSRLPNLGQIPCLHSHGASGMRQAGTRLRARCTIRHRRCARPICWCCILRGSFAATYNTMR